MKTTLLGLLAFLFLLLPGLLRAQEAAPQATPLSEPLLQKRAPDFACWTITRRAAEDSGRPKKAQGTGADSKTTIVKTNGLLLRSMQDAQGQVWNTWCVGNLQVTIYPNQKDHVVQDSPGQGDSSFYQDYSKTDFPDFDWVTPACYAGTKTYKGRPCLVFYGQRDVESWAIIPVPAPAKKDEVNARPASEPSAALSVAAYIDAETRLPVAIRHGAITDEVAFQAPPKEMLKLPDMVDEILNRRTANRRALTRTIHAQP
jgi:hypothetical protein